MEPLRLGATSPVFSGGGSPGDTDERFAEHSDSQDHLQDYGSPVHTTDTAWGNEFSDVVSGVPSPRCDAAVSSSATLSPSPLSSTPREGLQLNLTGSPNGTHVVGLSHADAAAAAEGSCEAMSPGGKDILDKGVQKLVQDARDRAISEQDAHKRSYSEMTSAAPAVPPPRALVACKKLMQDGAEVWVCTRCANADDKYGFYTTDNDNTFGRHVKKHEQNARDAGHVRLAGERSTSLEYVRRWMISVGATAWHLS